MNGDICDGVNSSVMTGMRWRGIDGRCCPSPLSSHRCGWDLAEWCLSAPTSGVCHRRLCMRSRTCIVRPCRTTWAWRCIGEAAWRPVPKIIFFPWERTVVVYGDNWECLLCIGGKWIMIYLYKSVTSGFKYVTYEQGVCLFQCHSPQPAEQRRGCMPYGVHFLVKFAAGRSHFAIFHHGKVKIVWKYMLCGGLQKRESEMGICSRLYGGPCLGCIVGY